MKSPGMRAPDIKLISDRLYKLILHMEWLIYNITFGYRTWISYAMNYLIFFIFH